MITLIQRADGGVSIMRCEDPVTEFQKWSQTAAPSWLPASWVEISQANIQADPAKRAAWIFNGVNVVVDESRWSQHRDTKAAQTIDAMDRLQFEHLFDLENRTRILELKPQITRAQYRQALIDKWKTLNP